MSKSGEVVTVDFNQALSERYLSYAMSTIMSRSLPDVRDGLKPVHRRLLYAMLQLKLDPKSGYKKCARVVGDVIGKYHPHGDVAVYDTLVRLAQSFSVRYPLVDGQGNFGSIDGDNAAAMRYTEAKLTEVAMMLLQDIDRETVDFRPTYDSLEQEPILFPANFPNLLANGSEGIAVGMATSIPPHNVHEICDALLALLDKPSITIEEIVKDIKGPDFPTGGIIVEPIENIIQAYKTGRGNFRVRAKWEQQVLAHGLYQIVITEIPYQVQKSRLIEKLADLFREKKLVLISNIRDESTETVRIIIEPKNRSVDPATLMEALFKLTELETKISLNMNVLSKDLAPRVMNLKEVLESFIEHRKEVIIRRSNYRLGLINQRLHILEGLLIAYLNIDEVIKIIREEDEPKAIMMKKWKLSDIQVDSILNMRLRSLRKLEEFEIKKEQDNLLKEKTELEEIINKPNTLLKVLKNEIKDLQKRFGNNTEIGKRRTEIIHEQINTQVIDINAFVEKEPITIIYSKMGWIRAVKGHGDEVIADLKFKEGDELSYIAKGHTTDKLLMFSSNGRFYTIPCDKIQRGKGFGEPIRISIDLESDHDIVYMNVHQTGNKLLLVGNTAKGFIVDEDSVIAQTKNGKQVMDTGKDGVFALGALPIYGDHVAVIGENRKLLIFPVHEIPSMRKGQGVTLQKYKQGTVSDVKIFNIKDGLTWINKGKEYKIADLTPWIAHRATGGRMAPNGFPMNNRFEL
ncbi:MAG: DNA topoisomerase IV subunit A [Sphingobacteriia bacterium]|nr:DNA topoisomerase IV subunit A [Sphingobacteriia bacterium]